MFNLTITLTVSLVSLAAEVVVVVVFDEASLAFCHANILPSTGHENNIAQ